MKRFKTRFKSNVISVSCPELICFEGAIPHIKEYAGGNWELEFLIYAKVRKIRDTHLSVGLLLSDYYCFEDELVYENEEVKRVDATVSLSANGGFAFSVRGLTAYDEYYFRPYAVYNIGGQEVILYGNIMNNELLARIYKPVFLPVTDEEETESFSLSQWVKENGYENAGITTYFVGE